MARYSGDVTLPDGRQFHVVAVYDWEPDTNAGNLLSCEITTLEGEEVGTEEWNTEVAWPNQYDPDAMAYLWEVCVDLVSLQEPEDYDPEI